MNKEDLKHIKHIIRETLNLISEQTPKVKVKKNIDEDNTEFIVYIDGEKAGKASMEIMFNPYD